MPLLLSIAKKIRGYHDARRLISSYCMENVKRLDYENFLATLLLPSNCRDSAFAIRAFNVELAQVKDVTREEIIARMRLQFWRESLDKLYEGPSSHVPNNPVARALLKAKQEHNLSKRWLKLLIESREEDLLSRPYANIEGLEMYAEKSNSSLYYLILQSLGISNVQADHAASHIGKSEGIIKLIRSIPHYGSKHKVPIPMNLLVNHNVSEEEIIKGSREKKVMDLVFDLASAANQHLEHAKKLQAEMPKGAIIGLLPAVNVASYLRHLQLVDFDVFNPKLQRRNGLLPYKLWWSKFRNTYR